MSLTPGHVNISEVRDPRIIVDNVRDYAILKGGEQVTQKQYTSTSISLSSIQFSCPPPSGTILVDRKMYLTLSARLTILGTPPVGQTIIRPARDGPRAFPISSSIDTFTTTINNQTMSVNMADTIQALMRYNTCDILKNTDYSATPSMLDQSQSYDDLFGTVRNPLAGYGDSSSDDLIARGGFPYYIIQNPIQSVSGTQLTAIVDIMVCEPLFLSPFYWGHKNGSSFYNVNSMDFNLTFLGGNYVGNRWWSHGTDSGQNVISSISVVWGGMTNGPTSFTNPQPVMLFNYITPQENQVIPREVPITYPYFDVQRYPTDYGTVNAGVSVTMTSNNLQLSSIPRRIYVFARQRNADLYSSPSNTDTFFSINNINVQFMNKNGLLSAASQQQLYQMSVKNHCNQSWSQWNGQNLQLSGANSQIANGVGSVACIEFGTDIGLSPLDAPGKMGQYLLQVTVNATNLNYVPIFATLYIITVLEGTFTIEALGKSSLNIGVISSKDILDAHEAPAVNYKSVEEVNGGDFFSGLKDFGSKLWKTLEPVHDFVKANRLVSTGLSAFPQTRAFAPAAYALGYGEGEGDGGVLVGGAKMSRKKLKNRLM